ncbi:MAG TPA: Ldh family oxidoreductase [Acetobacteraceae bacterium]|nr:Ldh family oxidoreductase [Acetobacteraceae bacterium]
MPRVTLAEAERLAAAMLVANRTAPAIAASVARALVAAEAEGQSGHGLSRLPSYAAQAACKKVDGFATPTAIRTAPAVVAIDAAYGFAYPALDLAIAELLPLARAQGVALAAIRRSHHCGAAGITAARLAEAGVVGLMLANTPAAMAAAGGRRPMLGTNPIAAAFPAGGADPVVIDLALSAAARGRIVQARARGEAIPEGWALDAAGQPTTDPEAALAGSLLPFGGAKGAALALMVEALAAGLTGSAFAFAASSFLDAEGPPPATGQLLIAIDPAAGGGGLAHLDALFAAIAAEPGVRLPGRRRRAARRRAEAEGIDVPERLLSG